MGMCTFGQTSQPADCRLRGDALAPEGWPDKNLTVSKRPWGADRYLTRIYLYRLRSLLRRHWPDYLVLTLLVGVIGGVAMGSVVAGRRTQSSFAAFLRHDDASTLTMSTYGVQGQSQATLYSPAVEAAIRRLPSVQDVESWIGSFVVPIQPNGVPDADANNQVNVAASVTACTSTKTG